MAEELVGHIGSKDASDTADDFLQLVSFRMGHEEFGVDILYVREINRMGEITEAPKLPEYVEGIISLRGKEISIVRLRKRMGFPKKE